MNNYGTFNFISKIMGLMTFLTPLQVPDFYTCGAEGFWRPTPDPTFPLVYPACAPATPAQRVFKINMQFPSSVICNAAGQNVLSEKIRLVSC